MNIIRVGNIEIHLNTLIEHIKSDWISDNIAMRQNNYDDI